MTTASFARWLKINPTLTPPKSPKQENRTICKSKGIDNLFEEFTEYRKTFPTGSPPNTPETTPTRLTLHCPPLSLAAKDKDFELAKMNFEHALELKREEKEQKQQEEPMKEFEPTCLSFK